MAKPEKSTSSTEIDNGTTNAYVDTQQSLQERLHTLLTRLSDTGEILKKWPETKTGDDSSIHIRTTDKLINSIQRIIDGIKQVEEKVNSVPAEGASSEDDINIIANKLRQIAIPLDLLDMMDFAGGINPDCFARGLIKEALRQMGNLQRRKTSMRMLAVTIQNGMNVREKNLQILKSLDEKIAASDDDDVDQKVDAKDKAEDINEALSIVDDAQAMLDKKRRREDDEPEDEPPSKR
jgi:hypothetical protein